jgi:hypothetical protein
MYKDGRGVNDGWAGWAIAHPGFGEIVRCIPISSICNIIKAY